MDFRLKVFHSVATNLSFTKASKELFISQPAISKHIHELEVQYKTPLFDRVGSHIGLTHAGELLLSHTKQLLAAYRQMDFEMNLLTDNFAGELRLGASTTISQYVLPPVLASFIKKFPEIKVSLLNGNSRDIEQALREGKITLGLIEGTAHQSTLHYTPFMRDELVVVAHTGSSLAAYDEISLEQLRTLPLVLRENGSGTLDVVEAALAEHQVKLSQLNVVLQMGSTESIKLFLEIRGVGNCFYPCRDPRIDVRQAEGDRSGGVPRRTDVCLCRAAGTERGSGRELHPICLPKLAIT